MKNLRGGHSTLISIAQEISDSLLKKNKKVEISPGFIEAGIKAKTRSVTIFVEQSNVIKLNIVAINSKQSVRIYNSNLKEIKSILKDLGLVFRERELTNMCLTK